MPNFVPEKRQVISNNFLKNSAIQSHRLLVETYRENTIVSTNQNQ